MGFQPMCCGTSRRWLVPGQQSKSAASFESVRKLRSCLRLICARQFPRMPTITPEPDLWSLVSGNPSIDPSKLLAAVVRQLRDPLRDFRTRLLLRDALVALERHWGRQRLDAALAPDVRSEPHH